jgi:hypothetical protein
MGRELHGLADGVQDPAKDYFPGFPTAAPRTQFLGGYGFVVVRSGSRLGKDLINSLQQVTAQSAHTFWSPLANLDIVIHEDVGGAYWFLEGHVGRWRSGFRFSRGQGTP